jgi:hypothetical protein
MEAGSSSDAERGLDCPTFAMSASVRAYWFRAYAVFWRFMVVGAMRYPWVLMTERGGG